MPTPHNTEAAATMTTAVLDSHAAAAQIGSCKPIPEKFGLFIASDSSRTQRIVNGTEKSKRSGSVVVDVGQRRVEILHHFCLELVACAL